MHSFARAPLFLCCALVSVFLNLAAVSTVHALEDKAAKKPVARIVERGDGPIDESFVVGKVKNVSNAKVDQLLLDKTGMVSNRQAVEVEVTEAPAHRAIFHDHE